MTSGIHSGEYRKGRALARAEWAAKGTPCHLCHQPIDYTLDKTDPEHFQLDHIKSRKRFPHLEFVPANWAPAHASCNKRKSDGDAGGLLGVTSEAW